MVPQKGLLGRARDLVYMALLSDIIDAEPSSFEEAVEKQVWKDAMQEEY